MRSAALAFLFLFSGCSGGGGSDGTDPTDGVGVPEDLDAVVTNDRPSKRSEVRTAIHEPTNSIMIFGGNDGPIVNQIPSARFRNDTWIYEPGTGWTEVVTAETPRKRSRYAIAVDEGGNRALMFGGRFRREGEGGDYRLYNDLWEFDFLTREWSRLHDGAGRGVPDPRYYGQGAWDEASGTFYVWGGNLNTSPLSFIVTDELWAWKDGTWTQLQTSGEAPSDRSFLGSVHDPTRNRLVVFGGQVGDLQTLAFNDTYALDLDTLEWEQLDDGLEQAPSTRMHGPLTYDTVRDRYLLFGGHTDFGDDNDLWAMNPETGRWRLVEQFDELHPEVGFGCLGNPSEVPADYVTMDLDAPERRHNGMVAVVYDSLWVFGGMHAECSDHLDDTWRFDLETQTWTELLGATSGESCLRSNDDCACLCL